MRNLKTRRQTTKPIMKRKPLKARRTIKKTGRQIVMQMDRSEEILNALASLSG
jgi:hypothetical protein